MAHHLADLVRGNVQGEVFDSQLRVSEYASDASNYRVPPRLVVFPRDAADVLALVGIARDQRVPLTARGGGTSVAGNSIGPGIVMDLSVHMNRILDIDPAAGSARVQPGVVLSTLQAATSRFGLRMGPDPSTQNRATIGGMIGNNACGPHTIAYGKTADNVVSLEIIDGTGRTLTVGDDVDVIPGLRDLVSANFAVIRKEFGRFGRQVSGYSLEHLLPEHGRRVAQALVGAEGTLGVVTEATVKLVPEALRRAMVVLAYPSMADAADDVPLLLEAQPIAMEGLDARLVDVVRRAHGSQAVPALPPGGGWLIVELGGDSDDEAIGAAKAVVTASRATAHRVLAAGPDATRIWQLRADGAGLGSRTPEGAQAWPGWEDASVPPESLGSYLRGFEALLGQYGLKGLTYGHFGDGCVHVRLDIPLEHDGRVLRDFVTEAADLVLAHGGSPSGEHGDGRARSELLSRMYSAEAIALMRQFKGLFDPGNLLNPGVIVDPQPLDLNLRRPRARPTPARTGFAFAEDQGDFAVAVHRCVGVGKCRADTNDFMCPSYQALKDEDHVTRGRARVLQDLTAGEFGRDGWSAATVSESLDLCLSCKACARDCPVGVDIARYKSEVLHRAYAGKLRPRSHYSLGWLPRWTGLAGLAGSSPARRRTWFATRTFNMLVSNRHIARALLWAGGIDTRRSIPRLTTSPLTGKATPALPVAPQPRPRVAVWIDSFTAAFAPDSARAAFSVLHDAGYEPFVADDACCGLTWISTGQLTAAKLRLEKLLDALAPVAAEGVPIVGLEPSCLAVLRSDLLDLLPDDPRAASVAAQARTVAELLSEAQTRTGSPWIPPSLENIEVIAQPHCHHHSVMGFDADTALLARAGASITILSGCCGMAGNFGMERGHYETSLAVAELQLLPAIRDASPDAVLLADGFSCRTQAQQLADMAAITLVELFAQHLKGPPAGA